jgi:hypothetical protein
MVKDCTCSTFLVRTDYPEGTDVNSTLDYADITEDALYVIKSIETMHNMKCYASFLLDSAQPSLRSDQRLLFELCCHCRSQRAHSPSGCTRTHRRGVRDRTEGAI